MVFSLKDGTKRQQQSGNTSYGTGALLAKRVSCSKTLFSSASSQFLDIHLFLRLTPPPKQTIFSCKLSNPGHYRFTILIPRESVFFLSLRRFHSILPRAYFLPRNGQSKKQPKIRPWLAQVTHSIIFDGGRRRKSITTTGGKKAAVKAQ